MRHYVIWRIGVPCISDPMWCVATWRNAAHHHSFVLHLLLISICNWCTCFGSWPASEAATTYSNSIYYLRFIHILMTQLPFASKLGEQGGVLPLLQFAFPNVFLFTVYKLTKLEYLCSLKTLYIVQANTGLNFEFHPPVGWLDTEADGRIIS